MEACPVWEIVYVLYLSTHGVFSVCRRSSETVRLCTVHSSFFSCLSVVPYKWAKEPCFEGNSAGIALSAAAERRGCFAARTVSSDTFFIKPTPPGDIWQSFHQSHTSADLPRAVHLCTDTGVLGADSSGCGFQFFPPGLYWGDVFKSEEQWQIRQSFHSLVLILNASFIFSIFFSLQETVTVNGLYSVMFYRDRLDPSRLHTFIQAIIE